MNISSALELVPVRRTPLGFEYVVVADVPARWRKQCWASLKDRNAQLIVEGVGPSALIHDWRLWLESLLG